MIYKLKGTLTSAIFVLLVLLILSLIILTPMLSMIILAAVFAYAVRPIARKIQPFLKFESVAILVAMMVIILPLIAILVYCIDSLIHSAPTLISAAESMNIGDLTTESIQNSTQVQQYIPADVYPYLGSASGFVETALFDILRGFASYLVSLVQSLPNLALELFVFFAATFYLARDGDRLWKYVDFVIPNDRRGFFDNLFREVDNVLKSIFFGHFLTAIIVGAISGIGFYLLGYPYSLFLGILTGFCQVIPFIGHWPTYTVLVIYDFFAGNYLRLVLVVILSLALSILDMYLRPQISGKYADIHPMIFLLGFICGPLLLGLVGFIIGPLVLGVAYAAFLAYKESKENESDAPKKDKKELS
ncbi:AI-2E family transporter [Methanobacterium petrolearium]|uniref:AI-2E family transporter n=1 Tax=Methanobacterium petrolearium TaxID=710190 RepID=UPI001AE60FAD|nr:AI-2E family transporter [Methanobacterium petrolearium]MBP1946782.1 putative PurR-regulated permease PerM [Methanobacterium petrolearium]BDZ69753.1 AI-2E family transporter [Methanobacterium petrolearium]